MRRQNGGEIVRLTIGTTPGDEELITRFGERGDGGGQFMWPAGVAVDSDENVYVADEWPEPRIRLRPRWRVHSHVRRVRIRTRQFNRPSGIVIDDNDDVYVSDTLNHRIQKLDKYGKPSNVFGRAGDGDGEFNSPWGITTDSGRLRLCRRPQEQSHSEFRCGRRVRLQPWRIWRRRGAVRPSHRCSG